VQRDDSGTATGLIHVGRQPIYDRQGDIFAYELLFRDAADATVATRRSAEATSKVIVSAFTEFGLDQLVGAHACFINVTREFLTGELPVPFDSNRAVLEIVETVEIDDAVISGVTDLIARGFTIALDDYTPGAHDRLLELTSYVKVDLLDADADAVAETVRHCRTFPHIELIAERLETEEDLQRAMQLGFTLFQGHVLGRPHVVSQVGLSPGRVTRLQLLTALTAPDVDFDEVVALITRDPAIAYRLLQATNSAASGLSARVSSIREAAVLLGLANVRNWVVLMLLSELAGASEEQLSTAMTRARVCQAVAEQLGLAKEAAFTTGLLSGVGDLLGQSPADLADHLPLSDDVGRALVDGTGDLGRLLTGVRDYERGDPTALASLLDPGDAALIYLRAAAWSNELQQRTKQDPPVPAELT
jgi:c-di-GMP-related signal transduction protein